MDLNQIYITPEDLAESQISKEELISVVKQLNVRQALALLCRINLALQNSFEAMDPRNFDISQVLYEADYPRARSLIASGRPIITVAHLRISIWLVLRYGFSESKDKDFLRNIAKVLLHSIGAFAPSVKPLKELPLNNVAKDSRLAYLQFYLQLVHTGHQEYPFDFSDFGHKLYVLNQLSQDESFCSLFEETYQFSLDSIQFALISIYLHFREQSSIYFLNCNSFTVNFKYLMAQNGIQKSAGDYILKNLIYQASWDVCDEVPDVAQLDILADRPLIMIDECITCADMNFMRSRMSREVWNLSAKCGNQRQQGEFRSRSGKYFEEYCIQVISRVARSDCNKGARLICDEILDGLVDAIYVDGETAVLFEFKSSPLKPPELFSDSPVLLAKAIDEKFIRGTKGNAQGFQQIKNHLPELLMNRRKYGLENVTMFVPVVVSVELAVTNCFVAKAISEEGLDLFEEYYRDVPSALILHIRDLDFLVTRTGNWSLAHMINEIATDTRGADLFVNAVIQRKFPWDDSETYRVGKTRDWGSELMNRYVDHLENVSVPSLQCKECGGAAVLVDIVGEAGALWCSSCAMRFPASAEEVREGLSHIEELVRKYDLS